VKGNGVNESMSIVLVRYVSSPFYLLVCFDPVSCIFSFFHRTSESFLGSFARDTATVAGCIGLFWIGIRIGIWDRLVGQGILLIILVLFLYCYSWWQRGRSFLFDIHEPPGLKWFWYRLVRLDEFDMVGGDNSTSRFVITNVCLRIGRVPNELTF
jgi:hypothetical protein